MEGFTTLEKIKAADLLHVQGGFDPLNSHAVCFGPTYGVPNPTVPQDPGMPPYGVPEPPFPTPKYGVPYPPSRNTRKRHQA